MENKNMNQFETDIRAWFTRTCDQLRIPPDPGTRAMLYTRVRKHEMGETIGEVRAALQAWKSRPKPD